MPPQVSVVIPVLNRPEAVRRAVASVLAQTFQDFEVVVVDDGSTDATPAAVAGIGDPRIRLVRHGRRRGGSAARNTGIRESSAPFVAFLDSDDEWLPEKLERQIELFMRSDENLALVYCGAVRVYADGSSESKIPVREPHLVRALLSDNVVGETSVGMVRRSALDTVGFFDEDLPASQDMDLWLRLCEQFRADFVPDSLVRIAKSTDPGRISASIPATTQGRELFRRKHREKLVRHGRLHLHLRESAWWYLRGARDRGRARLCALDAWRARPFAFRTYVLLAATCIPMSWLDAIADRTRTLRISRLRGRGIAQPNSTSTPVTRALPRPTD